MSGASPRVIFPYHRYPAGVPHARNGCVTLPEYGYAGDRLPGVASRFAIGIYPGLVSVIPSGYHLSQTRESLRDKNDCSSHYCLSG